MNRTIGGVRVRIIETIDQWMLVEPMRESRIKQLENITQRMSSAVDEANTMIDIFLMKIFCVLS